ncbi:Uncharacterized protein GBIM_12828, partial [Gryllus bimaculatus]
MDWTLLRSTKERGWGEARVGSVSPQAGGVGCWRAAGRPAVEAARRRGRGGGGGKPPLAALAPPPPRARPRPRPRPGRSRRPAAHVTRHSHRRVRAARWPLACRGVRGGRFGRCGVARPPNAGLRRRPLDGGQRLLLRLVHRHLRGNFREQRIDGSSLPLLTEEHLTSTLGLKLGPALKLRALLARRLGNCAFCLHCVHCHGAAAQPALSATPVSPA